MSNNQTAPPPKPKFTRIALKDHHIMVPTHPLDVVPPKWARFVSYENFGGPRAAHRIIKLIKDNGVTVATNIADYYLICSISPNEEDAASDDSTMVVMITGFKESQDVGIWIISNFNGDLANTPFGKGSGFYTQSPDGTLSEKQDLNDDVREAHLGVSIPIGLKDMHLVGTLGIRATSIDAAIDSMPEDLFEQITAFESSDPLGSNNGKDFANLSPTNREKVRHEILAAILIRTAEMVQAIGPVCLPSLAFANSGVTLCTNEVCPITRKKSYSDRFAISAFPVFSAKHIMRVNDLLQKTVDITSLGEDANNKNLIGADVGDLDETINNLSAAISIRVNDQGKPEGEDDLAASFFLGSISRRYLGTRECSDPPPLFWCNFIGFVAWTSLSRMFSQTQDAFDPWEVSCHEKDLKIISNDTTDITFAAIDENKVVHPLGKEEAPGDFDPIKIERDALEKSKQETPDGTPLKQALQVKEMVLNFIERTMNSLSSFTDKNSAKKAAKKAVKEIVDATNSFDLAPDSDTREVAAKSVKALIGDIAEAAIGCKTPDEFMAKTVIIVVTHNRAAKKK